MGSCSDTSSYYFANAVNKEKVLLPSSCHLFASGKVTANKIILNNSRFDGQSIMEGRSALQNDAHILLVYIINQNTTVIIQALHNLKPEH